MEEIQPEAGAANFTEESRGSMFNRVYLQRYSTESSGLAKTFSVPGYRYLLSAL